MENAKGELSNRVQHSINCRVFLWLPLDRAGQFSAGFALVVAAMQEQRKKAGNALQGWAAGFALRFALCRAFPPFDWLCKPIFGIFNLCPTLFRVGLCLLALAPVVVANEREIFSPLFIFIKESKQSSLGRLRGNVTALNLCF